ncbi:MAG: hypothetical protein AUJ97_07360 [Bacteroidetes bacterium CG2_30_32_10]|nr:MAG: hypothetical protein AUJ97_07360 [Bacteroidetes bacterium CG2_30_32_10]
MKRNQLTKFWKTNKELICFNILATLFLLIAVVVYARAGGGGGSSGGGGGDGIGALLIYLILAIPFPWNLVVIAIIVVLYYFGNKKAKQQSILNKLPTGKPTVKVKGYEQFILNNPTFDEFKFKDKVKTAFIQIQDAWQQQNLGKVRKFISDGVYQRFNTQFKMMKLLKQTNTIDKLTVKNIYIDKIETDGKFDIIHTAVHASIVDRFVSEAYPQLNSGGSEEFVEYWSFIKKRGVQEANMFNSQNCPKCGAELSQNAGDVSKCEYCGAITNLGDYDWVLSEITQADDYISANPKLMKEGNLAGKIREMFSNTDDFSIQQIEDKVSNGYLQIQTARVAKDPTILRRFVTNELYETISKEIPNDNFIYNRLFLNDVTLVGAKQEGGRNILMVAVKSSYQRVVPQNKTINLIDYAVISKTDIVFVTRDINVGTNKGSIYAHSCPNCGGVVKDTIDIKCQYCGSELNSTKNEWIISNIMDTYEYQSYFSDNSSDLVGAANPNKIDGLFAVRDFAFNNLLIMMAADGVFDTEEIALAERIAKRWGYNIDKIQPMFDMAKSGSLVIRMPDSQKHRKKIYHLMEKAAKVDGSVSLEEQQLLDNIKKQYPFAA